MSGDNILNREWILFNLREAAEELTALIESMETNERSVSLEVPGNLETGFAHLYHHVNSAWNGRNSDETSWDHEDAMFDQWRAFPLEDFPDLSQ